MGKNFLFSKTTSSWLWGPPSFVSNGLFLRVKRLGLEFDYAENMKERSYKSVPHMNINGMDGGDVTPDLDIKFGVIYISHFL
jgi:hypothetical protein